MLQFRLGCHKLPIATGRRAGVVRASRQCTFCSSGALGDERHLAVQCVPLAVLRAQYADLLTATTSTMRSILAQRDHLRVFHYVIDCWNCTNAQSWPLGGACDQTCWLAEARKVLHLLLHLTAARARRISLVIPSKGLSLTLQKWLHREIRP